MIFVSLNHYINLHLLYSGQRGGGDAVVPPFPTVMRTVDKNGGVASLDHHGSC